MPLPLLIPLAALALSAAGTGYGMLSSEKQKKKAQAQLDAARGNQPSMETPQAVKDQLADAQSKYGAVNPALLGAYQQALQAQSNQQSFAQRNASSGAQALSAASEAQNQTQSILPALSQLQTGYDQQNRAAYVDALKTSAEDSRIKQADAADRNQAAQQFALGQLGAANANKSQAIAGGIAALGPVLNYAGQMQNPNTIRATTDVPALAPVSSAQLPVAASTVPELSIPHLAGVQQSATAALSPSSALLPTPQLTAPTIAQLAVNPQLAQLRQLYYNPYRFRY